METYTIKEWADLPLELYIDWVDGELNQDIIIKGADENEM